MATATKTTTARKTAAKPVDPVYDFDSWSEEAEEAALAALADGFRYIIVGSDFVGKFSSGLIVKVSLNLSADAADEFEVAGTPRDQLVSLLAALGADEKIADQAAQEPMHEVGAFVIKYQALVESVMDRAAGDLKRASLGE